MTRSGRPGVTALALAISVAALGRCEAAVPAHPGVVVAPTPAWIDTAEIDLDGHHAEREVASAPLHYLLLDDQVLVDGRRTSEHTRLVYRILTPAGLDSGSQREVTFDPSFARVVLHHLRVHRGGAWSDRLDDAWITVAQREADFSRQLYDGSLSVLLVLKDVQVGDVVSLSYTVEGSNPVFGSRWARGMPMAWSVPVDRRRVRALVPPDRPLAHRLHATDRPACRVSPRGGRLEYTWDLEGVPALRSEPYTPDSWDAFPWLQLTQYGSWGEVADWAAALYRVPEGARPEVARLAARLRSSAPSDDEALLAAIRWVQDEVRYFGIVLGPNSHAPHPPDETIRNRFGDCKDKALLLVALLRRMGAEAWPVLVDLEDGEVLPDRLPSPGAFDHVIVALRSGDREVWVDPTLRLQGGSLDTLHLPDMGNVLVVRPGETELSRLPAEQTDPGLTRVAYVYAIEPGEGRVEVTITTTYQRAAADDMRGDLAGVARDELARRYIRFYSRGPGRVEPTAELEVRDDRVANLLTTVERYRLVDWWEEWDDGSETFDILPLLMGDLLEAPREAVRRCPLAVPRRVRQQETVTITAGPDWELAGVEALERHPWFAFRATSRSGPGRLDVDYELETFAIDVEPEQLAAYLEAIESLRDATTYTLTRGGDPTPERGGGLALAALGGVVALALLLFVAVAWALRRGGPV